MAVELGYFSITPVQKLSKSQQFTNQPSNPTTTGLWMWNPKHRSARAHDPEADDSWEVRAFEEDTNNAMGTAWPPCSYTCTFCRQEFRSAQALGGHMNVHRRDRARLHQTTSSLPGESTPTSPTTFFMNPTIHHQEVVANGGGLCLDYYSLPNPNGLFSPTTKNHYLDTPFPNTSTIDLMPPHSCLVTPHSINSSSICHSTNTERSGSTTTNNDNNEVQSPKCSKKVSIPIKEELDLELRLGRMSSSPL